MLKIIMHEGNRISLQLKLVAIFPGINRNMTARISLDIKSLWGRVSQFTSLSLSSSSTQLRKPKLLMNSH